jgi:hypothetical protein
MADLGVALLAFGVVVGSAILVILLIAFLGLRTRRDGAALSTRRVLGWLALVFGFLWLIYVPLAFFFGGGIVWILGAVLGPSALLSGWAQLHSLRSSQVR